MPSLKKILPPTVSGRGGDDPPPPPHVSPNTVKAQSYARVLDLLGHGEWEGLINGAQSIYFDETPLVSIIDGKEVGNFPGVSWNFTNGTQNQDYLAGFDTAEVITTVQTQIKKISPVIRTISTSQADRLIITVRIPALYAAQSNGDVLLGDVALEIHLSMNSEPYQKIADWQWHEKFTSEYSETRTIVLPRSSTPETDTWQVKLVRTTDDHDDSSQLVDAIYWESYTTVVSKKLSYPNMVLAGIEADASSLNRIPTRGYHCKMKKIRIPVNYDPIARTYATTGPGTTNGGWDGTFKVAWSNNPAWVFLDLLADDFYGLGDYIPSDNHDKWTLYEIAKYCDTIVPDGFGGTEPLFVANLYLMTQDDALKVLSDFASIFRGLIYYYNGRVMPIQDRPKPTSFIFTKANVKDGMFNYTSTGRRARKTAVMVKYLDKETFYKPQWQPVEDYEGIIRYGYQESEVVAYGATSRGQAYRYGRNLIETEKREGEGISFRTGQDALLLRVGNIIEVLDADRANAQVGGRILAGASSNSIILDRPVTLTSGNTYSLTLVLPKAMTELADVTDSTMTAGMNVAQVETLPVSSGPGTLSTLSVTGAYSISPPPGAVWVLSSSALAPRKYRVLSIKEIGPIEWEISGNFYDEAKFDTVEQTNPNFSTPPPIRFPVGEMVLPVSDPVVKIRPIIRPDGLYQYIDLSWKNNDPYTGYYRLTWSTDGGAMTALPITSLPFVSFPVTTSGYITINIYAVCGANGRSSIATPVNIQINNTSPIQQSTVIGLGLKDQGADTTFVGKDVSFTWALYSPNADALATNALPDTVDPLFSHYRVRIYDGVTLKFEDVATSPNYVFTYEKNVVAGGPLRTFTIKVAAVDTYNNVSADSALTVTNPAPSIPAFTLIPLVNAINFKFDFSTDTDFRGYLIWMSTTNGFTPGPGNLVYDGPDSQPTIKVAAGSTWYAKIAAYDAFGQGALNISPQQTTASLAVYDTTPPSVPANLASSTNESIAADGSSISRIRATWNANTEDDFTGYILSYRETSGYDWISLSIVGINNTAYEFDVKPDTNYSLRIAAFDRDSNVSAFSLVITQQSAKDTTPPAAPTSVSATASIKGVFLAWTPATAKDLRYTNIYRNTSNTFPGGTPLAKADGKDYIDVSVAQGTTYYYFLKSEDNTGNETVSPTASVSASPGKVATSDITDFAVDLTKTYKATIALANAAWTDNSPGAGSVAWNSHTLYYQGFAYTITAGNTSNKFVYWDASSPTTYQTASTNPALTDSQFMIATNVSGVHDLAWNALANALVGTAYIENLAVTDAKISSMIVDKLLAGTITSQAINIAGGTSGYIQSSNYVANTSGWRIDGSGNFFGNNAVLRGTIYASAGTIGGYTIGATTLTGSSTGNTAIQMNSSNGSIVLGTLGASTSQLQIGAGGLSQTINNIDSFWLHGNASGAGGGVLELSNTSGTRNILIDAIGGSSGHGLITLAQAGTVRIRLDAFDQKITFAGDATVYRYGTNAIGTGGNLIVTQHVYIGGKLYYDLSDTVANFYRTGASNLKTDGSLTTGVDLSVLGQTYLTGTLHGTACEFTGIASVIRDVNGGFFAATPQASYALTVIHQRNAVSKYGLFVATNWAAAENRVINACNIDATTGAQTDIFRVYGDGYVCFGSYAAITSEVPAGYVLIKDLAGNIRKVCIVA